MENEMTVSLPIETKFEISNSNSESDHSIEKIRQNVKDGKIVILKKVFSEEQMLHLKKEIIKWGNNTPIFPHGESPSNYPSLNYHRIDDGSVPSVCPHIFHQYGFNSINDLDAEISVPLSEIANKLTIIQNLIGETKFEISVTGLRLKVLHYPEGGAFLHEHTHPLAPQNVGLILSLSKIGVDFTKGAAAFMTPEGFVDTVQFHNIGDLLLFRYDLQHEVTPVNPEKNIIDWNLPTGKWSLVLELRDTHNLSHKK